MGAKLDSTVGLRFGFTMRLYCLCCGCFTLGLRDWLDREHAGTGIGIGIHTERLRFKHKEPPIRLLARRDICSAIALDKGEKAAEDFLRDLAAKFPSIDVEDLHTAVDALATSNHVRLVDLSSLPASRPGRVCVHHILGHAKSTYQFWKRELLYHLCDMLSFREGCEIAEL